MRSSKRDGRIGFNHGSMEILTATSGAAPCKVAPPHAFTDSKTSRTLGSHSWRSFPTTISSPSTILLQPNPVRCEYLSHTAFRRPLFRSDEKTDPAGLQLIDRSGQQDPSLCHASLSLRALQNPAYRPYNVGLHSRGESGLWVQIRIDVR